MNIYPLQDQSTSQDIITFDRVSLRYGRGDAIFNDVSFALKRGSLNFVTGISGAGKTSLLQLMYLQIRPSQGLVYTFGQDTALFNLTDIPDMRRRMGIVLQDYRLINHLSVFENVALPLRVIGRKRETYMQDVISLLQWIGLGEHIHAFPKTLSGGQAQRAAIARAIITKPEILIADEPTGNVDNKIGKRLIHLFTELNRQGTTIIIATHNMSIIPQNVDTLNLSNAKLTHIKGGQNG